MKILQMVGISPEKVVIINPKNSLEVGGDKYRDIWGYQTVDVQYTGGSVESPSELDWENWGTMVPIARRGDIWEIATGRAITTI